LKASTNKRNARNKKNTERGKSSLFNQGTVFLEEAKSHAKKITETVLFASGFEEEVSVIFKELKHNFSAVLFHSSADRHGLSFSVNHLNTLVAEVVNGNA